MHRAPFWYGVEFGLWDFGQSLKEVIYMFALQFYWQGLKKRLLRTMLCLVCLGLVFLLEIWILSYVLHWEYAFAVQFPTVALGGTFFLFYLLVGFSPALQITGLFAGMFAIGLLPSSWGQILAVLVLAAFLTRWILKRRQLKRQLLQSDPDMTKAQAAEMIDTAGAVRSSPIDEIRRMADLAMEAGFLIVEDAAVSRSTSYLLLPTEMGLRFYTFADLERIEKLLAGDPVDTVPDDISVPQSDIMAVSLSARRRLGVREILLTMRTKECERVFVCAGAATAAQIESFLTAGCGIPVYNQVQTDMEPLPEPLEIAEEIRQSDSETVSRMRSSRWLNRLMTILCILSIPVALLGGIWPALLIPVALCPVIITLFYIRRQDCIKFDGTRQGKPSLFFAYFCNPGFSTMCTLLAPNYAQAGSVFRCWPAGLLAAAVFFFSFLYFVDEHKGKVGLKIGMSLIAAAFGTQFAVVLALIFQ